MTIFDKNLMFFDGDAGAATASGAVDLGAEGIDEPLDIYFGGNGLTAGTNLVIEDSANGSTGWGNTIDITVDFTVLNQGFLFRLPPKHERYVRMTVTLGAGGTMTAGVVLDGQMGY